MGHAGAEVEATLLTLLKIVVDIGGGTSADGGDVERRTPPDGAGAELETAPAQMQ